MSNFKKCKVIQHIVEKRDIYDVKNKVKYVDR